KERGKRSAGATSCADKRQVSFAVRSYDKTKPLMIGPVLSYSTYLGGSGLDAGGSIAVDSAGSAYVAAATDRSIPTTSDPSQTKCGGGFSDAFVAKVGLFVGIPVTASCEGDSISQLNKQFGSIRAAAGALGFSSVQALQDAIHGFCLK